MRVTKICSSICQNYASINDIKYNSLKTVCIACLPKDLRTPNVPLMSLNNKDLSWVDEHKYLGVFLTSDKCDNRDILRQLRSIYARGNMLVRRFGKCSEDIKIQLFRSYCSNQYCSQLWCSYTSSVIKKIAVAYNNVFRWLMKIRGQCSMSELYVQNNICAFKVLMRKSICSFRNRLLNSNNSLISVMVNSIYFVSSSQLYKTWCDQIF